MVKDGEVEIRYVIPTSPTSEHVRFCHLRSDYFRDEDAENHEASDVDAEWKHWAETKLTV